MAARVSSILNSDKSIKKLVFDTTGVGYFEAAGKKVPDIAELNALLDKKRAGPNVKISSLREVEIPKADGVFEVAINGLG